MNDHSDTLLGKDVNYDLRYDPGLLHPIDRPDTVGQLSRSRDFHGEDLWTSYEFSCLSESGRPVVAIAHFALPFDSGSIIESKSFKLYLNSFNHERFASIEEARLRLEEDLTAVAGGSVKVAFSRTNGEPQGFLAPDTYTLIDDLDCSDAPFVYEPNVTILENRGAGVASRAGAKTEVVEERLYSELLRSNCPVTGQPDWASVFIHYRGPAINHESLLRYIISYRNCQDFHEHCVEKIFSDLMHACSCQSLSVYARYTRRGGLDINPYRATLDLPSQAPVFRTLRQ